MQMSSLRHRLSRPHPRGLVLAGGARRLARPYIGALSERSLSGGGVHLSPRNLSKLNYPGSRPGCWSLRPLRDPGFRFPGSQPSGRQTGRGDGALERDSRVTGQGGAVRSLHS